MTGERQEFGTTLVSVLSSRFSVLSTGADACQQAIQDSRDFGSLLEQFVSGRFAQVAKIPRDQELGLNLDQRTSCVT